MKPSVAAPDVTHPSDATDYDDNEEVRSENRKVPSHYKVPELFSNRKMIFI